MSTADLTTGFFGKIPATGDFVTWNLPRTFIDRWDRWISMELRARPDEGELDPRAWRFVVPAGIFSGEPCAGVWRMSEDRVGRRYPLVVVALGVTAEPADSWFGRATDILAACIERGQTSAIAAEELSGLPPPASGGGNAILFWRDDWEVHELHFADIHDLAANGLPAMRFPRHEERDIV